MATGAKVIVEKITANERGLTRMGMKMAKQNQHIEDYLDAYRQMADVDFAVMITGPWGCGKTWFVKQYLEKHCTAKSRPCGVVTKARRWFLKKCGKERGVAEDEKEYIYISLNGVADTADIDMAIFQAAHPVLGSKLAVTAGKVFKASIKAGLKIDLDVDRNGVSDGQVDLDPLAGISLARFKLKAKGKLLVFDDLERCLLSPQEVFGYINAFVENKEAKVVIVGDELHFNKMNDEQYVTIKEKVIGKTFRLTERIEEIFDDLVASKEYPKTHAIIIRNKDTVVRMFKKVSDGTDKQNYRALKHCFRDFEYFYPLIGAKFIRNDDFVNALFEMFHVLDYEMQLANFSANDLKHVDHIAVYRKQLEKKEDEERNETNLDKVIQRHGWRANDLVTPNALLLPNVLWGKIFRNELLEETELSNVIKNSEYFPDQQPEWVVLWHWMSLIDNTAEKVLRGVREKIDKFEYRSREVILHVFAILLGLADRKAIPETKTEIVAEAKRYIDKLVENRLLDTPGRNTGFAWSDGGSFGLGYWGTDQFEFKELVGLLNEAVAKTVASAQKDSVPVWLSELSDVSGPFYPKIAMNGEFCREPILALFQPQEFVAAIVKVPNDEKWMVSKALKDRYELYGKELVAELPFVIGVVEELGKRIEECKCVTPTAANLQYLKAELEKVIPSLRLISGSKKD